MSKSEAIARADAICRDTRAALVALGRPPSYDDLARARAYEERSAAIERGPLGALDALSPPPRERRLYEDFVEALGLARELALEAIEQLEADGLETAEADLRQRDGVIALGGRAARAYGFNVCGRPAGGWGGLAP